MSTLPAHDEAERRKRWKVIKGPDLLSMLSVNFPSPMPAVTIPDAPVVNRLRDVLLTAAAR
jgi:hypothetical protein